MGNIVLSIAPKVAEYLAAPIGRRCGYLIFSNSYVGQLKEELEKLDDARVGLQRSVVDAENNMREIKREVNRWKNDAETVANKARGMLDDEGRAKKTCFCGWLPNPKERYCLGRDARKTAQAIQALIPQGKFERVYYESDPPGRVAGTPDVNSLAGDGGDTIVDSRASVFQGIMEALDDEKLKVIGVYGPGGVGKTTLLEEVEKKLKKQKGPFHMIVKAKASQNPVSKNIQDEIADALKLDLKDLQSESGRANRLLERLQRDPSEKVLIILDDLWEELDLKAVGIPSGDNSGKCKLFLASRFEDVLKKKMCANKTFFLGGLNNDEAFGLFAKAVGNRLEDDEDLKAIAAQVVKKLAGLPLLIISVAKTLKESPVSTWRIAQIEIDESTKEIQETIVKLSYGHLKSEDAKCLFLLCGLIGGTIQVELLWVLGMGLGLFEKINETIQNSRDRLNNILDSLRSICLLQDGGDDKKNVTIHDLYSEVIISNPFSDQNCLIINSDYGSWPKEKLEKCWACLVNVGNGRLAELMLHQFPHVKILMLSEQYDMGDFTYMEELRALYLSSMHITSLPASMEILRNLQSLSINCYVGEVANLGKLKALQILSFDGSIISRLPKEIGKLTNLRSLNLNHCYLLKIIEPGALKGLINLEELHMKNSFDRWMGKHEIPSKSCVAGLAELKSLTKLASLEISIPDPIILLEDGDLPFENLHKFWIKIGYFRFWIDREYEGLTAMSLNMEGVEGCDSILSRKWFKKNLQKTQCLYLSGLSEFKESPHELCTQGFREVKYLNIEDSPSIKYIVDSSNADPSSGLPLIAFGKLESFFLKNLINLEKICHGPIAPKCFSKLKVVSVHRCNRLKYLWCLSNMQRLVRLEKIEVWGCDSMQSIFTHDAGEDIVATNNKVELSNVRRLVLNELPNMTSFCTKAEITSEDIPIQVSLPCLESLVMVGLLGLEKILYSEPSLKYSNLKYLEIEGSTSTSIIMKDWILKLPNLESMKIAHTSSVEVVFDLGELKVIKEVEILSRLSTLELSKLRNLRHMWKQDVQLQGISILQNLKKLFIKNTGLSFLFPLSVAKCLREIRDIKVVNCPNMKAVIVDEEGRDDGIDDIVEFPLLERISISRCPTEKFFSYPRGKKESITTTSNSQDTYSDSFFDQKISLPSLEKLILHSLGSSRRGCGLGLTIVGRGIWHNELPKSSSNKLANLTPKQDLQSQGTSIFWNLKVLSINNTGLSFLFSVSVAKCLREIREIEVEDCPNMNAVIVDEEGRDDGIDDIIEFPLLKRLSISRCPTEKFFSYPHGKKESITTTSDSQDIYSDSFFDQKISLPSLEKLILHSLGSSRRGCGLGLAIAGRGIWHSELPQSSSDKLANLTPKQDLQSQGISIFRNLKVLSINNTRLSFLFLVSVAKCLREIREIEVEDCSNMKAVIVDEEGRDDGIDDIIEFPLLERLSISHCPTEKFFSYPHGKKESITTTSDSQDIYLDSFFDKKISLPSLEKLILHSLGSSRRGCGLGLAIAGRGIWHSELPQSSSDKLANLTPKQDLQSQGISIFRNLKVLSINNTGLSFLFSVSVAKCLREIREIEVEDCSNMKAVIVDEEGRDDGIDDIIEFPLLERLSISHCPTEKFFSYPHGKKESITTTSDSQDIYLDSFFDQKISLPSLEKLILHSLESSCRGCGLDLAIVGRGIWHSELPKNSSDKLANLTPKQDLQSQGTSIFRNLKVLSINNTGLSFLFSVSVAKCLREIREIEVEDCPNMNAVIVDEEGRDNGTYDIIEFPLLERLSISHCPTEKFFSYPHGKNESITTTSDSQYTYLDSFFDQKISLPSLEKLKLELVGSSKRIWHSGLPKSSFNKLAEFTLEKCSNLLDVFPSTIMGRLQNLKIVEVSRCPSLESLFDFGSLDSYTEQKIVLLLKLKKVKVLSCPSLESLFNWGPLDSSTEHKILLLPKLEEVAMSGAGRLRHMVMSDSQTVLGFPNLKEVYVHNCSELRSLFPNYTVATLKKLNTLCILKCEQMKEVVPKEEGGRSKEKVMSFLSLTILVFWRCPNIRAFIWSPTSAKRQLGEMINENDESPQPLFNDMVTFPNLEKLYIGGVRCKELWNNQISYDSFCKLKYLILKDCDNLQHIAPSHMWKRLQDCLETLEVKSCRSIEIIYESDGTVAKSGNLRMLDLRDLDNLRHIWQYDNLPNIPFSNLRYIKAMRCSRLDMLFATFTAKFLGQIEKLVVGSCEDMELIAGHEECEEMTGETITFFGLTTLRLYNLPKLKSFIPEKYFVEFPSLDDSSRIELDRGNRSAEESEGETEQLDRIIEELDREIEEADREIEEESKGE